MTAVSALASKNNTARMDFFIHSPHLKIVFLDASYTFRSCMSAVRITFLEGGISANTRCNQARAGREKVRNIA